MIDIKRVWDESRYSVWRRRILAVPDQIVTRNGVEVRQITHSTKLSAINRAWRRAVNRVYQ